MCSDAEKGYGYGMGDVEGLWGLSFGEGMGVGCGKGDCGGDVNVTVFPRRNEVQNRVFMKTTVQPAVIFFLPTPLSFSFFLNESVHCYTRPAGNYKT